MPTQAHPSPFKNRLFLYALYLLLLVWIGGMGFLLAWPPSWLTLPILLCVGIAFYRMTYAITISKHRVPTLASGLIARQKIAEILEREAQKHPNRPLTIVDLGSGRGELTRRIARRLPQAQIIGVELARLPHYQALFFRSLLRLKNLSYQRKDFWSFDCSSIDAIVLYLAPVTAQRMGEKLKKEMKFGSLILSHTFPLQGEWEPDEIISFRSPFKETLYVYRAR